MLVQGHLCCVGGPDLVLGRDALYLVLGGLGCYPIAYLLNGVCFPAGQLLFYDYLGLLLAELLPVDHFLVIHQQAQRQSQQFSTTLKTVINLLE